MASITKTAKGYRAQVYVHGVRDSGSFGTRREAVNWAAARETELRDVASKAPAERHTFADMLRRYRDEVSPGKRGVRWEEVRINAFLESKDLVVNSPVWSFTSDVLGGWRNKRLQQVSAGTVLRELGLLSAIFEHARREWKWIPANPVTDVRKPRAPDHRDIVISRRQIRAMLAQLGYRRGPARSMSQAVAVAFLVALRTGMRAGELCGLTWDRVHDGYCELVSTKTVSRDVPLTAKALRLVEQMRGFDDRLVFGLKSQTLDALFRRARERAGLKGFVFHDSRHTAATWIAGRLKSSGIEPQQAVLDLCKIFGWGNISQALVYYNPKAADIAKRIG